MKTNWKISRVVWLTLMDRIPCVDPSPFFVFVLLFATGYRLTLSAASITTLVISLGDPPRTWPCTFLRPIQQEFPMKIRRATISFMPQSLRNRFLRLVFQRSRETLMSLFVRQDWWAFLKPFNCAANHLFTFDQTFRKNSMKNCIKQIFNWR